MQQPKPLLEVKNLTVAFRTNGVDALAVDDVSFRLERGETLGIVGESGCGKTVTVLSILRLLPTPPARVLSGEVWFDGKNLLDVEPEEMRHVRGGRIAMVFQEPMSALNPVLTVGTQIEENLFAHTNANKAEARSHTFELLDLVGIPDPRNRYRNYPHELSGGMRQRVLIAMALACNPDIIIADEPTTALDVTIQAQILDLFSSVQRSFGLSLIFISHNLGVIARVADRIAIMYASRIVETGMSEDIFQNPAHPYTLGLLRSIPRPRSRQATLDSILGMVPQLGHYPTGCTFHPRCGLRSVRCFGETPILSPREATHSVACFETEMLQSHTVD